MKTAKETIIEKILTDLPIASCRGEMTKEEWRGWFEEAFEKGEKYASQSKWVSCAERLPDHEHNVLAILDGKVCVMNYFNFFENGESYKVWGYVYDGIDGDGIFDDNYYPTKWQEIPTVE